MTAIAERMDIITAIGNLTHNTVSGSLAMQGLTSEAMNQFPTILNQESNENLIVHILSELSKWLKLSPSTVPAGLIDRMRVSIITHCL